jgi:hypothetical protein
MGEVLSFSLSVHCSPAPFEPPEQVNAKNVETIVREALSALKFRDWQPLHHTNHGLLVVLTCCGGWLSHSC